MIKYLGSKRLLLPRIVAAVTTLPRVRTALDLFSGTARVGHALKRTGLFVTSNDHNAYAATLARCYVQADARELAERARRLLSELRTTPPRAGWFTHTYCEEARYFTPENGAKIEAIRDRVDALGVDPVLKSVLLVSLMEAADRVDSTVGVQMAYLKSWARRAHNPLELRLPELLPGPGLGLEEDALAAAARVECDVAYLDPPYNQHSYLGNYHVWETLVRWDAPDTYGVAQKRVDCKTRKSDFNLRHGIGPAFTRVVEAIRAAHLVVSFSDEGRLSRDSLIDVLSRRGHVRIADIAHTRYIGSQIGIFSPSGERVGTPGKTRNVEMLLVVSPRAEDAERAVKAALSAG